MEEFKKIKDFEMYSISKNGIVIRTEYDIKNQAKFGNYKVLKQYTDKDGYLKVCLSKKGKTYYRFAHRLVALTFIENPLNKKQVNHKDGIKNNNNVENLEWCTSSENIRHRIDVLGVKLTNSKLRKKVLQYDLEMNFIAEHISTKQAARTLGILSSHIAEVCRGKKKTYKGFIWKYDVN